LNNLNIKLPSLNQRIEDIEILIKFFVRQFYLGYENVKPQKISDEVINYFKTIHWRGNVRELKNVIYTLLGAQKTTKSELALNDLKNGLEELYPLGISSKNNSLTNYLLYVEKKKILTTLSQFNHNLTQTAKALGISRQNLQYRMKKLRIRI